MNRSTITNLHSLWDSVIINDRIRLSFNSSIDLYYEHIHKLMLFQSPSIDDHDIQQWVRENMEFICRNIYFDDNYRKMNATQMFSLGINYYERSYLIIEQRLAQSGRRLGALLNQILYIQSTHTTKYTIWTTSYILLALLGVVYVISVVVGVIVFIKCRNK